MSRLHPFVQAAVAGFSGAPPAAELHFPRSAEDLDRWKAWIAQHDVQGLLFPLLEDGGCDTLAVYCRERKRRVAARNLELFTVRARVEDVFREKALPLVWLKGMALTETLYPAIGWRSSSDLDALVREQDLALIRSLLKDSGFETTEGEEAFAPLKGKQTFSLPGNAAKLELHWRLTLSSKFPLPQDPFASGWVDTERPRLQAPLEWLFLACHNVQHLAVSRWVWLWDLHLLGKSMAPEDWQKVASLARQYRLGPVLGLTQSLLELFFQDKLPIPVKRFELPRSVAEYLSTMEVKDLEAGKLGYFWRTIGNPFRFSAFVWGFFRRWLKRR